MLAIRLQRLGRKGYPTYRIAVQESRRHPSSGRVVTYLGSYNPHTKSMTIDSEKTQKYLDNGAQPTDRVVSILNGSDVKFPEWVKKAEEKKRAVRNPDKLRKNQPKEEPAAEVESQDEPEAETSEA